jgi:hypothetical protein
VGSSLAPLLMLLRMDWAGLDPIPLLEITDTTTWARPGHRHPQTTKACTLAPQTTKTFEKCPFWRNIPTIPLQCVIFQLKNSKKKFSKKTQKT